MGRGQGGEEGGGDRGVPRDRQDLCLSTSPLPTTTPPKGGGVVSLLYPISPSLYPSFPPPPYPSPYHPAIGGVRGEGGGGGVRKDKVEEVEKGKGPNPGPFYSSLSPPTPLP